MADPRDSSEGMDKEAFSLFGLTIYWYGIFYAGGFLAAIFHWARLGRKAGKRVDLGADVALWLMLGVVSGARIAYIIANWPDFAGDIFQMLNIRDGGLIFYGGLAGGILSVSLYARLKKEPAWSLGDFVITGLPLGHALGRVGCFMNGCCYGSRTDSALGVVFDGVRHHPTQLYETFGNLIIYTFLLSFFLTRPRAGRVVALYLMLYPTLRFLLEFVRGDERMTVAGLHTAQWISVGLFLCGIALWIWRRKAPPTYEAPSGG